MFGQTVFNNGTASSSHPLSMQNSKSSSANKWTPDPMIHHLLNTMQKVGPKPNNALTSEAQFGLTTDMDPEEEYEFLEQLLKSRELNALVKAHNVILFCNQEQCPCVSNSCEIASQVMEDVRPYALMIEECRELYAILTTPHIRNLMASHDIVAQRDYVPKLQDIPVEVDEDEGTIKMVQLVKSSDPMGDVRGAEPIVGATIKADDATGRILIARVMHGGAADRSGLISVGDEIIEVNGYNVEGKTPNDVLAILQMAENTITFKLVPNEQKAHVRESRVRLKALFDYEPMDDVNIPCKEAGLPFSKGDILHIVSQEDKFWWQARREEDRTMRAGLIPSRQFQEKRLSVKRDEILQSQYNDSLAKSQSSNSLCGMGEAISSLTITNKKSKNKKIFNFFDQQEQIANDCDVYMPSSSTGNCFNPKISEINCAMNSVCKYNIREYISPCLMPTAKTKIVMYNLIDSEDYDKEEIPTYDEVARLFPRTGYFRPIVLIGPPGVGRNEIKRRIMAMDADRYQMTIPHTSRSPRPGEVHGRDYIFESREKMQQDIDEGKYIEHGEFKGNLYGTSVDGIQELVEAGLQPIISPHHQALKKLLIPDIRPYVIYIKAPTLEKLQETRHKAYAKSTFVDDENRPFTDEEFQVMLNAGNKMEFLYGHLFDISIVNDNVVTATDQVARAISRLDQDAQWVPISWLQ